jgi:hypothetical protein
MSPMQRKFTVRALYPSTMATACYHRPLAVALVLLLMPRLPYLRSISLTEDATAQTVNVCSPSPNRILQAICGSGDTPSDLEREVVQAYLISHHIPLSEESKVYQYGKKELRNDIRAALLTRLLTIINSKNRTTSEQAIYNWFQQKVWDNEKAQYQIALADYQKWRADPCKWKIDADVAKLYNLNYDGAAFCAPSGLSTLFQIAPVAPTRDYFLTAALKDSYHKAFVDPVASNAMTDAATRLNVAVGASVIGAAVAGTWLGILYSSPVVIQFIFHDALISVALMNATAGPLIALTFALAVGSQATMQVIEAQKVQSDLDALVALTNRLMTTPPDLRAYANDNRGLQKLTATMTALTLPEFESPAAPPLHNAADAMFLITPQGGVPTSSPTFSYRDWTNSPWAATSSGGWLVHSKASYSTMVPTFPFQGWDGQHYLASRVGPNFLISKKRPSPSDTDCPASFVTGYSMTSTPNACRVVVLPSLQIKDASGANVTIRVAELPEFTSPDRTTFTKGVAKTFNIAASGAPAASLYFSGSLPSGIAFASTGPGTAQLQFSGAGADGTYPFILVAQNAQGIISQNFQLTIGSVLQVTSPNKATFRSYEPGSFTITTSGSTPVHFELEVPLPSGMTLTNNGDGTATIAGTPLGGGGRCSGPFRPCGIIATNAVSTAYHQFEIEVLPQPTPVLLSNTATFGAGVLNRMLLISSRNNPPVKFLLPCPTPSWLAISDNGDGTAYLSGTPPANASGSTGIYVGIAYSAAAAVIAPCTFLEGNQFVPNINFTINIKPSPEFTSVGTIFGLTGVDNEFPITTNQSAGAITAFGPIVPGMTFRDNGNGIATLFGRPQKGSGGYYALNLIIQNGANSASQILNVYMLEAPAIQSQDAVLFHTGIANNYYINTTGFPKTAVPEIPSQWRDGMRLTMNGSLPPGVTFNSLLPNGGNSGVGLFSGTPANGSEGTYPITITASNGAPPTATMMFTLIVARMGDVNSDSAVDCGDISVVRAAMGTRRGLAGYVYRADVNNDGVVDIKDLAIVSSRLAAGTRCQ